MNKIGLKLLLMAFVLSVAHVGIAESAQTIKGKSLAKVDDVVKEVSGTDLSLPKKGLITLRAGNTIGDVSVFATVFDENASASTKGLGVIAETKGSFPYSATKPHYLSPAVSRRLYNGKRALMTHNFALNGQLTYYFKTLSNTRSEDSAAATPQALANSVQMSDFGEYTPPVFKDEWIMGGFLPEVYGTGVMSVKGYGREIFVAASGPNHPSWMDKSIRLEFFALSADEEGNMSQEPLTALTHETPFNSLSYAGHTVPETPKIVSLAVGDFDGDKYYNEVALMINTVTELRLFVYRLNYSDGKLSLMSLGDAKGINVHSTKLWGDDIETQPASDMVAGDFDGDGIDEIAVLFKTPRRPTGTKDSKGWPDGPMIGEMHCRIYKWNAEKRAFNTEETIKDYSRDRDDVGPFDVPPSAQVAGVVGVRAAAADIDGDGKSEIVTLLVGYYHRKVWDHPMAEFKHRGDYFCVFPHLAVWTFTRGSIKPIHDDNHIKGGSNAEGYDYNWLRDHAQGDKKKALLKEKPHLEYERVWYNKTHTEDNKTVGTNPDNIKNMYVLSNFSIAAGPFTGTLGQLSTVDDIAVVWKDNGSDNITVFKTKLNANKQFDGFEDGKLVYTINLSRETPSWFGAVAADFASEGVELDTPTHLRKLSNRSYIAALNAVPYHVDNVSADGSALTEEPVNFTYSEPDTGGNMTVSYGKSTTDNNTNTVKQDLSQSVETMFLFDPEAKGGEVFAAVKGAVGFASAVGDIVTGIRNATMSSADRKTAVWKDENPVAFLNKVIDFVTDKVTTIDQRSNTTSTTTIIDKNITATTHDAILYTESARHIWRYPVLTRPLPMWLAWGPRIDSTSIDNPGTVQGDKELYITFTMSENSPLRTSSSQADSVYQPLHEEGNFFSYPSQIADVEGYNESGLLAEETTWEFSNTIDQTGITFTKAKSNMRQTEKKVTPSTFTSIVSGLDKIVRGKDATGLKMPDTDNPKTFSKEFSKTEKITYTLQGSSELTAMQAADHTIRMQPFVAKEGAMRLAAAVQLTSTNYARLWEPSSIYQKKPDPALYLPFKFVKKGTEFVANTYDKSAMKIRGIKFYMSDFAFFTDNRLVNGQNYEIRVPLYNASFKDTGRFEVRLSYATDNSPTAVKTPIETIFMTLGGWSNNGSRNKGTAVFNWKPNLTSSKKANNNAYYLYVEIDPNDELDEVHNARHKANSTTINDYGGNNTGFYPFYVYDANDDEASSGTVISSAADEIQLTPLYFTDGAGQTISDMASFIRAHSDEAFVTVTANFNYTGPEVPYAFFTGYFLTQSGRQKMPGASLNTIVDLSQLEDDDISDVFLVSDIALFKGQNQVTFTISPSELLDPTDETATDSPTFGVIALTEEEVQSQDEEFYEGEDPEFELEPIPDDIVASETSKTYTLTSNGDVFWQISNVKFSGTVSTSDEEDYEESDDRDYLDITLETENASDDTPAPSDYGQRATIKVSSIAGYTPKGDYEITVQKSEDGDEWTDAEILRFNAENAENSGNAENDNDAENNGNMVGVSSTSSGCNSGLGAGIFASLMAGIMVFRKKLNH